MTRFRFTKLYLSTALIFAGLTTTSSTIAAGDNSAVPITLTVFGDWPYSQFLLNNANLLINSVNNDAAVEWVVHVGDIHSGSQPCTSAGILPPIPASNPGWNQSIYFQFQQFHAPVIYTPGDNEWADCHKSKQFTSGAPLKELGAVRSLFFARPGHSLGLTDAQVWSQSRYFDPDFPKDANYVENAMWKERRVLFATFNLPGGSNNDDPLAAPWTAPFTDPVAEGADQADRTAADIRWLESAFATAEQAPRAKAVVLFTQADMWDPAALTTAVPKGPGLDKYTPFVAKLAELALKFGGPVLLINGDTHLFFTDKPLADPNSSTGKIHNTPAVSNLTRIVVQGSTNDPGEWLRLTVDTRKNNPFSWVNVPYCAHPSTNAC